jgi:CRISPR/Cas system CMR subunit Cmr4 (Cas7 group RAMP superfamily)
MNKKIFMMVLVGWINSAYGSEVAKLQIQVSPMIGRIRKPIFIQVPENGKCANIIEEYRREKNLGEDTKITLFVNQKQCNPDDDYTKKMLDLSSRMVFVQIDEVENFQIQVSPMMGRVRTPTSIQVPKNGKCATIVEEYRREKNLSEDTKITLFMNQKPCNPDDDYTQEMLNRTSRIVFVKIGE